MFQMPPGMGYKQFQAAGMPGYKSDIYQPPAANGERNAAGGSVYQPSRFGKTAPSMPRYDQAQPVQQPSQGTPYGAFDQGRWQMGNQPPAPKQPTSPPTAPPTPGVKNYGTGGAFPTPEQMMQQEIDAYQKRYQREQSRNSLKQQLDYWKNMFDKPAKPTMAPPQQQGFEDGWNMIGQPPAPPTMTPPQKREWGDVVLFNGQQGAWNGGQQFGQMPQAGNSMFAGGWPDATRTPAFGGFGQPTFGGGRQLEQFGGFNPRQQPQSFPGAQQPFANGGTPQGFLPGMWAPNKAALAGLRTRFGANAAFE